MRQTTYSTFVQLAARGNVIPVCREIVDDLLTPVSAFLAYAGDAKRAFLLESVEGGERVARYSFLGKDPFLTLRADGRGTTIEDAEGTRSSPSPFLEVLRERLAAHRSPAVAGLPRLTSGAVGFIAYDAAVWFEPAVARGRPDPRRSASPSESAAFMFFDTILAFDHVSHRILIIANARISPGDDLAAAYRNACARLDATQAALERPVRLAPTRADPPPPVQSLVDQEQFEAAVRRAKQAIVDGDVYQVVLSRRFDVPAAGDPFTIYRALRHVNPSPYLYFLRLDDDAVIGSSPEMLVRVEGRAVETHPIAGTRPRGATPEEDARLAADLLADDKERAEHVMLVDLGRNDLGRVCRYGSVTVERFMDVVRYSHVMHLASTVKGQLAQNRDCLDALGACFPAGTVSGAPKIRAMELIRELEREPRGLYAGAVGYIDFAGNLDCCIAIRTIMIQRGVAHVQAGAGIVFDSDPAKEYAETTNKASALLRALHVARTLRVATLSKECT